MKNKLDVKLYNIFSQGDPFSICKQNGVINGSTDY